jgi:hypothetical protein
MRFKKLILLVTGSILLSYISYAVAPANDAFASATNVTALINAACTAGGTYTDVSGTSDQSKGSCWAGGPYQNVWFKFTATATLFINIQVKVSGAGETMRYPVVALWTGTPTQLQCQDQIGSTGDLSMSYYGLTAGTTYYFSVDNITPWGSAGKFDLCLSDVADYDYPQGAVNLTGSINAACATTGVYSDVLGTADHNAGSCWAGGPYKNRWFKFVATATSFINVQIKVSGASETMRYPTVALWDGTFTGQIQCMDQKGSATDLSMSYYGLTAGTTYYISVDNITPWGATGTFDICLSDVADYDYPQGAVNLTGSINAACATTGVYSDVLGTADHNAGTCWAGGPYKNRWFKFVATATGYINVQVKVSGASETMRYPMVALWDGTFTGQIQCQDQNGSTGDLSVGYYGLTPGTTYYISVDNVTPWGASGTFDICLSDVVDYDYPQGAVNLTGSINAACGSGGAYSDVLATADHNKGSCWSGGPYKNRWFKFVATATGYMNVQVKVSGASETMRYPMVAMWDGTFTGQIQCQDQIGSAADLSVGYYGLTAGTTYYISVDNVTPWGASGTFDICLSDVPDYDYPQGAVNLTASINGPHAGCTLNGTYSNALATADHSIGSCWSGGPYKNRWFKFVATATTFINIQVKVSGTGETMRYPMVALWDGTFTGQIQCMDQKGSATDLSMSYYGLTAGTTYYISVDNVTPWGASGTFDICITDQPDYDYPQGAVDLTSAMNGCSTGGAYSDVLATADHNIGSCWAGGPYKNRWFKFIASATTFINVQVMVSGAGETMRYPMVALWTSTFTTQIQCQDQKGSATDLSMSYYGLTPGTVYYISVDNVTPWGSSGTFDICVSDQPDYDYPQGAITLGNLNNYCSTGGAYSDVLATADHNIGSCWSGGPYKNRWFKFQAISTSATIQVKVSGASETMRYPLLALWASNFTTQLGCTNQAGAAVDISLTYNALVVGTWYYISVDNVTPWGASGTFDICINNASVVQYYSIGDFDWSNVNAWSTTGFAGGVAGTLPTASNVVNIRDHVITVTSAQSCAQIDMTVSAANTSLTVDNATLTINGNYNVTNGGTNNSMITTVQNSGILAITNNASFTRNGGNSDFQLNIQTGSTVNVTQDMIWTSTAGTVKNSLMTLNGTGALNVTRDLTLSSSGGMLINHILNNTSTISVGRDITFTATAAGQTQITLNNTSNLSLKRNFVRGATPYGTLSCAVGASLTFNATANTQNMVGTAGSGGDAFNYTNVVLNNTSGFMPSIFLTGAATITGTLTMTRGVMQTTAVNLLTIASGATCGSGASNCFISGPMTKIGNTAFTFPLGKSTYWARLGITAPATGTNQLTAEYFNSTYANTTSYNAPLTNVSVNEYWTLAESVPGDAVQITLYWEAGSRSGIRTYDNTLRIAHWNGASWDDVGQSAISGGNSGNVTSNSISSFSPFTFGSTNATSNPLPIKLLEFKASQKKNVVNLDWITATETNNAYFTVEKTINGNSFEHVATVTGAGNSSSELHYSAVDESPFDGLSYYRLMQTDYDGKYTYSQLVPVTFGSTGESAISTYPNPASSDKGFFVELKNFNVGKTILLILRDIYGNEVYSKVVVISEDHKQLIGIPTDAKITPGVYFISGSVDNEFYNKKIVIQ